jgi:hypothetical protein
VIWVFIVFSVLVALVCGCAVFVYNADALVSSPALPAAAARPARRPHYLEKEKLEKVTGNLVGVSFVAAGGMRL